MRKPKNHTKDVAIVVEDGELNNGTKCDTRQRAHTNLKSMPTITRKRQVSMLGTKVVNKLTKQATLIPASSTASDQKSRNAHMPMRNSFMGPIVPSDHKEVLTGGNKASERSESGIPKAS